MVCKTTHWLWAIVISFILPIYHYHVCYKRVLSYCSRWYCMRYSYCHCGVVNIQVNYQLHNWETFVLIFKPTTNWMMGERFPWNKFMIYYGFYCYLSSMDCESERLLQSSKHLVNVSWFFFGLNIMQEVMMTWTYGMKYEYVNHLFFM